MTAGPPVGSASELHAQLVTELSVADLPRSLAFYRAVGFEVERATPSFAVIAWEGRRLFLAQHADVEVGRHPPNLRIMVEDVDAWLTKAQAAGWDVVWPLANRGYGLRDFTVLDPDGYEVRFATPA
jgi:catechol 2,3-dioxygenase-like lactoylglutathione lyase family enzyme